MLTIGEILHRTRIKKNYTIDDAARSTHIQRKYIEAIEKNDWRVFASNVYILGSLRQYAGFLDVNPTHAVAYFRRDFEKSEQLGFRKRLPSLSALSDSKKAMIVMISFVCTVTGLYFGYQFYLYLRPPQITIIAPTQTIFRNTESIRIIAVTQPESAIKIFNEDLYPDEKGHFFYDLPLKTGDNFISIKVTGPNGKKSELIRHFKLE